jgi:hypothetical protein
MPLETMASAVSPDELLADVAAEVVPAVPAHWVAWGQSVVEGEAAQRAKPASVRLRGARFISGSSLVYARGQAVPDWS